jgi:CDP-diacylglycerol--glycerol-3-phosphate 3-phosphatidyltransferase
VTGSIVSPALRTRVRGLATPLAMALGRLGLSPNALTVIGFLGSCLGAYAAANQSWLVAGLLVLVFGAFDLFDGTLARATGQVSTFGAFLDSTFDRAGEAIVYLGIAAGCLAAGLTFGALLSMAGLGTSSLVSYVRAKAESLGFAPGSGLAAVGLMPREIRIVILSLGLVLASAQLGSLTLALAIISIGSVITVSQRILHVRAQSREG